MSTTLKYDTFAWELSSHRDRSFTSYILDGISIGFDLGFRGPPLCYESRNMKSALDNPDVVDRYIAKELDACRILGPFHKPPFPTYRCSPIGVVPKKAPGTFRLIMDLSFPQGGSVNDSIDKSDLTSLWITLLITFYS